MPRGSAEALLGVGLLAVLTGLTANADAQGVGDSTRAAARSLGAAGVTAYQAGDYAKASDKLERAYQLLKAPSLGLWSARALEKLGKLVEAGERYTEVARLVISGGDVAVQTSAQVDARAERDALTPRIPTLTIRVEGADAAQVAVTLDGQPVPGGKRATASALFAIAGSINLTATPDLRVRCSACQTDPMPPCPNLRSRRYFPAMTSDGGPSTTPPRYRQSPLLATASGNCEH